ncbi:hypothetical protein GPECTOR_1g40 [Gonium pectorale]|uniref:Tyrosine specific protein phosphatases domain-containing protein n=1 Tax=Gonium pectorale TaxID=33097 RepID=A0A150H2P2_GONPE|nr:hypothetical protein GPECTOR_1g40 [Gonium pectorale]|eukprot:KXZ56447.1 hypothetical protein GPECTOR_1g40 [Gonium pectorale]
MRLRSKWCTREDPAKQKAPGAIPGLHSSWVGPHVLAMARPWQSAVEGQGLVAAFQKENIGMILNLQEVGEHASCGPGNLPSSGFTYDPESFMAGGIGYYNFAWRDMGVPSLERMMDIVQVMDYVTRIEGRKIAVHCHAGLGRTGLSIACFFVFSGMHDTAEAAIQAVRQHRQGAVQTSRQAAFVTIFAQYLQHLRCIFPAALPLPAAAGTEGGGTGSLLATQSAPPTVGADGVAGRGAAAAAAALLPAEGLVEKKEAGSAVVGVYDTGLTVTVPLQSPVASSSGALATASSGSAHGGGSGESLTDADVGLGSGSAPLPWNDTFHIQPRHFVKEAIFGIIAAAQAFTAARPPPPAMASAAAAGHMAMTAGVKPISVASAKLLGMSAAPAQPSRLSVASSAAPLMPPTFVHALAHLIAHHSQTHVDSAGLEPLAQHQIYVPLTGLQVESSGVFGRLATLQTQLNAGRTEGLATASVLELLMLLRGFFGGFAAGPEPASLTEECLKVIAKSYQSLFDGHRPATPGSERSAATAGAAGGSPASLELARQAYEVLEALAPRDSELLLLFAALLRVAARGSGPGCEEPLVAVGKWAVGLLLGPVVAKSPEAEEAVLSFLWYLAGRDEAYAMLLLLKRQRLTGGAPLRQRGGASGAAGGVDVPAMLAAAAASLAVPPAPPTPPTTAVPGPRGSAATAPQAQAAAAAAAASGSPRATGVMPFPPSPGSEVCSIHDQDTASVRDSIASTTVDGLAGQASSPRPGHVHDPSDPAMLPALQLAQLISADVQQLYRVSFREAIAGISTVLYPPPPATGRIEVHDVWR